MAKRGVLEHPKTLDLAARLDIMEPWALGLLEALWQWTAKYHPTGDLTGTKPRLFAASIRYRGDADKLWANLSDCGFIDHTDGRTLVHDWSEHADDAVRKMLLRRGEKFADGSEPYARKYGSRSENVATPAIQKHDDTETSSSNSSTLACPPEPLPEPLPEPSKNLFAEPSAPPAESVRLSLGPKAAKQVKPPDPRFTSFREEIERSYALWNPGLQPPWDGSEARQLNGLLKASPDLTLDAFRTALKNRGNTEGEVLSRRPRAWLGRITDFLQAPLDRYNRAVAPSRPLDGLKRIQLTVPDELVARAIAHFTDAQIDPTVDQVVAEAVRLAGDEADEGQRRAIENVAQSMMAIREVQQARERDEKQRRYRQAVRVCFELGRVSAAHIQRKCNVNYSYAAAWIDQMVADGYAESSPGQPLQLGAVPAWMSAMEEAC